MMPLYPRSGAVRPIGIGNENRITLQEEHRWRHTRWTSEKALDLVREINDGGAGDRIPTLVLTASLDHAVAVRAMDAGAEGAHSKAVSVPETVETIKRLTDAGDSGA
jgi:CheY-like chemotaxis protein